MLVEHEVSRHGEVKGVIPMLAAFQSNKHRKIQPVMEYGKELNQYLSSNPGIEVAVCQDKLRKWRTFGYNCSMLDLEKAYLKLFVEDELLKFQAVCYKNKLDVMTHMGFDVNVAPKIMSKVLGEVQSMDNKVDDGTDHYIDDIVVDEVSVSVELVISSIMG